MPTNALLKTNVSGTWSSSTGLSYSQIPTISGISHKDQLEVERVFTVPSGTVLTQEDFRKIYVVPAANYTVDETGKKITAFSASLPSYTTVGGTIVAVPAITNGAVIAIRRKSITSESLVNWVDGTRLTASQLNLQTSQLISVVQEILDRMNYEFVTATDLDYNFGYKWSTRSWVEGRIGAISTTVKSYIDTADTNLQNQITSTNNIDTTQNGRLDAIESLNTSQTSSINTLNTRVSPSTSLTGTYSASNLSAAVNGLDTRTTSVESRVTSVESTNTTQTSNISALQTKVGAGTVTGTIVANGSDIITAVNAIDDYVTNAVTTSTNTIFNGHAQGRIVYAGASGTKDSTANFTITPSGTSPTVLTLAGNLSQTGVLNLTGNTTSVLNLTGTFTVNADSATVPTFKGASTQKIIAFKNSSNTEVNAIDQYGNLTGRATATYGSSSPTNPIAGSIWYDSANTSFKIYDGSAWNQVSTTTLANYVGLSGNETVAGNKTFSGAMTLSSNLTVDTNTLVVDATNDRVGIGTNSPSTKLQINVPSTGTTLTGTSRYGGIHLSQTGTNDEFVGITAAMNNNGTQGGILFQSGETYGTKIHFLTTDEFAAGMKHKMTLDNFGKLGIGTASPSQKLHVYGSGATIRVDNTTYTSGDVSLIATGGPSANGSNLQVLHETGNSLVFLNNESPGGNFSFRGSGGTSAAITQTGTLVIGSGTINTNASFPNGLKLETVTASTDAAVGLYHYGDADSGNAVRSFRAKGSKASPAAVVSGNILGSIRGLGYNGSAFTAQTAGMDIITTENWTTGANGTAIVFNTTPNGSTAASMTARMRINHSGNVGIGTDSPSSKLSVSTTSATDGIALNGNSSRWLRTYINSGSGDYNPITQANDRVIAFGSSNADVDTAGLCIIPWSVNTSGVRITNTGNVGIGTGSPQHKLVVSNAGSEGLEIVPGSGAGSTVLQTYNRSDSTYDTMDLRASDFKIRIGSTEKVTIDSSGNIGINTNSPLNGLHIYNKPLVTQTASVNTIHYRDLANYGYLSGNRTGIVEIALPTTNWQNASSANINTMLNITIDGANYDPSASWQVKISAYHYAGGTQWHSSGVEITGKCPFTVVRLGYNTTTNKPVILLGETTTVWSYPRINLSSIYTGYSSTTDAIWSSGWAFTDAITSTSNYTLNYAGSTPIANFVTNTSNQNSFNTATTFNDNVTIGSAKKLVSPTVETDVIQSTGTLEFRGDYDTSTTADMTINSSGVVVFANPPLYGAVPLAYPETSVSAQAASATTGFRFNTGYEQYDTTNFPQTRYTKQGRFITLSGAVRASVAKTFSESEYQLLGLPAPVQMVVGLAAGVVFSGVANNYGTVMLKIDTNGRLRFTTLQTGLASATFPQMLANTTTWLTFNITYMTAS